MKCIKCLTVSILILTLFIPTVILAYTGQYPWDPIYFEVEDTQETKNSKTKQRLKSQYGISAFYDCYPCTYKDTSNPYTETSCLIQTEYCLERQELKKEKECPSGYLYFNGRCVTIDQGCKEKYGEGGYYRGVLDEDGKYSCNCKTGYEWNNDGTACIKKKIISCPEGFVLGRNKCVTIGKNCTDTYGSNVYSKGVFEGYILCGCKTGYEWNYNQTACIKKEIIIPPKVKGVSENNNFSIPEGALIRATNGIDIYIVKYVGTKKFKRLILSPSVFNNYGHLRWEDVMDVDWTTLNSFATSDLVRAVGDDRIYKLYSQGDNGQKRMIKNNSVLTRLGFDPDSIYEINRFDRESYLVGSNLE